MADTDTEERHGASEGMDMDKVRTELKAYDSYNVSPLAIDRTDDDKLAADYKLLVEAGSIPGDGSPEEMEEKRKAFEEQSLGGPVNESAEAQQKRAEAANESKETVTASKTATKKSTS